jgi:hypothetical protein
MIDRISVYNIALAVHCELDWQEQKNLQEAYDTYCKLPTLMRIQFDSLVKNAAAACEELFRSFPETNRTQLDMDIRTEIEGEIYSKLEQIFRQFLS